MGAMRSILLGITSIVVLLVAIAGWCRCVCEGKADGSELAAHKDHGDDNMDGPLSVDEWRALSVDFPSVATHPEGRRLQQGRMGRAPHEFGIRAPEFRRSEQNSNIWGLECRPWDRSLENRNETAVIAENTCFRLDLNDDQVSLPEGLDIRGRLLVDDIPRGLTIQTKFITVQGVLSIYNRANHTIGPTAHEHRLKILLTGSDDVFLIPNAQNQRMCPRPNESCNLGSKPFVVAGGQLDIYAMPTPTCPSWVRPITSRSVLPPLTNPPQETTLQPCDFFIDTDFANGRPQGWTRSRRGTLNVVDETYLELSNRHPSEELRYRLDRPCYNQNKNQPYLFQASVRLTSPTPNDTAPLTCSADGTSCLHLTLSSNNSTAPRQTITEYGPRLVQLDQWFDIHALISFSDYHDPWQFANVAFFTLGTLADSAPTLALANVVLRRLPAPSDTSSCATNDLFGRPPALSTSLGTTSHPYPFLGDDSYLLRPIRFRRDEFGNAYLAVENRLRKREGTLVELPTSGPSCIQAGSTYALTFKFRLQSLETHLRIYLKRSMGDTVHQQTVKQCFLSSVDSREESKTCHALITFSSRLLDLWDKLWIGFDTRDDQTDSLGDFHLSDLKFRLISGPMEHMILPPTVLDCWDAGAEVLITSASSSFKSSQVISIHGVEEDEDGNAKVTFSESVRVAAPRTLADSPDFAVEVALLSRNVIMEGHDQNDEKRGGHLMFYFTREKQHMEGVELRYFGQQGIKSRYPIHTHISGNMKGSVISKNVIRDSYQRCIVLQATYNLKVTENVAYRTHGHCFVVEEGGEYGNEFVGNLGASTLAVHSSISNGFTNETEPATFWSIAPYNSWENNVAAGGVHTGFSIHSSPLVRGESAVMYQGWNPSIVPIKSFVDNVAHSNGQHGVRVVQFHPRDRRGEFINTRSYRNILTGVNVEDVENLKFSGGIYADNFVQVKVGKAHDIIFEDSINISGSSGEAQAELERSLTREHPTCPEDTGVVGIYLTPFSRRVEVSNATFRFFGAHELGCGPTSVIFLDDREGDDYSPRTSFVKIRKLSFDLPSFPPVVGCFESAEGIEKVYMEDIDGSLSEDGTPGFLVGSSDSVATFLSQACFSTFNSCFQSCPGVCLKSLPLLVDDNNTGLVISNGEKETVVSSQPPDGNQTVVAAVLPSPGHYRFTFVDNSGSTVFPNFEVMDPEGEAECTADSDVSFDLLPPPYCLELLEDGDFEENRLGGWRPLFEGSSYRVQRIPEGQNSSFAMATNNQNKDGKYLQDLSTLAFVSLTIGRDLDTNLGCLLVGTTYEVEAFVKVMNEDGETARCGEGKFGCAFAHIKYNFGEEHPDAIRDSFGDLVGTTTAREAPGGWRFLHGIFRVKSAIRKGTRAFFYIRAEPSVLAPSVLVADNISIRPFDINAGPIVLNGDFEVGDNRFWSSLHRRELKGEFERVVMVSPGSNDSAYAVGTVNRSETGDGLRHLLQGDRRLELDTSYRLTAHFRLKDATDKSVSCPETVSCPTVTLLSRDFDEKVLGTIVTQEDGLGGGWKQLRAEFRLDETDEESLVDTQLSIVVGGVDTRLDILLDNVSVVVVGD